MTGQCFNCKEDITNHDSQKMIECLTALSKKTESLQKNLESKKSVLHVPDDAEAIEYFTKTKSGEPSRMGSN
jgi:hypothetical protein